MLEGGDAPNRVPDAATLTFDRRSVPPETSESFRVDLEDSLEERVPDALEVSIDLIRPDTPFPKAFVTDSDDPLVRTLADESGGEVRPFGAATEAGFFCDPRADCRLRPGRALGRGGWRCPRRARVRSALGYRDGRECPHRRHRRVGIVASSARLGRDDWNTHNRTLTLLRFLILVFFSIRVPHMQSVESS